MKLEHLFLYHPVVCGIFGLFYYSLWLYYIDDDDADSLAILLMLNKF